jgi:hypothetical protein
MADASDTILAATVHANGNQFTQRSVDVVQMLHYRTDTDFERGSMPNLLHQRYCEMVLHFQTTTAITTGTMRRNSLSYPRNMNNKTS